MNGTSGVQEVRASTSRLPLNQLLGKQVHLSRRGAWCLLHTHNRIACFTGICTKREWFLTPLFYFCVGLLPPTLAMGVEQPLLFSPLSQEAAVRFKEDSKVDLKNDQTIVRMIGASLNEDTLLKNAINPGLIGQPIRPIIANLFDDIPPMTLITEHVRELDPNLFEWVGHVQDDLGSRAIFVVLVKEHKPSMLAGTIAIRHSFFRIGSNQSGIHAIYELDLSKLPNEGPPLTKSVKEGSFPVASSGQQIRPIEMKLSDDLPVMTIITDRVESRKKGSFEWYGHSKEDPPSRSVIIFEEQSGDTDKFHIVAGVIHTKRHIYRIGGDWPEPVPYPLVPPGIPIRKIDLTKFHPPPHMNEIIPFMPIGCNIDVMVVYTKEAVAASPFRDIDLDIDHAFSDAQDALRRSGVYFSLRRVGKKEVSQYFTKSYNLPAESNGYSEQELDDVWQNNGAIHTAIHTIRDNVGADLVSIWSNNVKVANDDVCGIGRLMAGLDSTFSSEAYSLVKRGCVPKMSFLHELAHNMGANHNREALNPPPTSHNAGYGFFHPGSPKSAAIWGTIMAVPPENISCPTNSWPYSYGCRIFVFSNPDIVIDSVRAGKAAPDANAADNHWTLNTARDTVAGFRLPPINQQACRMLEVLSFSLGFSTQ
jgi:Metallo-peptidase family M12B Reprolysin-like